MEFEMPAIYILGLKPRLMENIPGSASFVRFEELEKIQSINGNDVLRKIPGLHISDEEGMGLRANIGIRGLDPDRSSKVLILEDGIPVALNPYGEPQMYYSPSLDRMQALEVLKGSGQILFGPQTIGGVINYITKDPPNELDLSAKVQGGTGGFFSSLLSYGNHFGTTGVRINFLHKSADDLGINNFHLNDATAKFRLKLGENSSLGLKMGIYEELSNSTYLGLSQPLFESGSFDFKVLAPDDRLNIKRLSASVVHNYRWNENTKLQSSFYGYTTTRNWQRQDFSYSANPNAIFIWGDVNEDGAIYMLDSNGHRNRSFEVAGAESKLNHKFKFGSNKHEITAGIRFHHETAFERRINGTRKDARSGLLKEDEIRTGKAFSGYFLDQVNITDRISVDVGVRSELYTFERNILRSDYMDTSLVSATNIWQLIPGFGVKYSIKNSILFAGIHRGFAPPRVKDAISSNGTVYALDPELSWNYELGVRSALSSIFRIEATAFLMDFNNQIIPVSESVGGIGSGLVNGGETIHYGAELSVNLTQDFGVIGLSSTHNLSYVKSNYKTDRFIQMDNQVINIKDNDLPYAPNWHYNVDLGFSFLERIQMIFNWRLNSSQFTDELNTALPSSNGRIGKIPGYNILDASFQYTIPGAGVNLYFNLKNVLNERYISSRRPQGIRVGLPRHVVIGAEWNL
jgi:Fe(3+) dicitrate transport protein